VGFAKKPDPRGVMVTPEAIRVIVVELEPAALGAPPAACIDESALVAIASTHDAPHRGRHVARARRSIRLLDRFSRGIRLAIPFRFEPFELFRHRRLDDLRQIPIHEVL
jgi:hypothetical protein